MIGVRWSAPTAREYDRAYGAPTARDPEYDQEPDGLPPQKWSMIAHPVVFPHSNGV